MEKLQGSIVEMERAMKERLQQIIADFRAAVGMDSAGWFCEKYGIGKLEWEAESQIDLIRLIAIWIRELEKEIE